MINHSAGPARTSAVSTRASRLLVLLAAFVCAACGLVYELELVALGSYLLGDSVTQASVVLSVMVFAMGVGSLLAKRFTRRAATSFALVECALALVGGLSVLALYGCFVWLGHYRAALVAVALLIGVLIGAEIPLLMTLIQRIRRQEAGRAVADLFAADYVGALVGGLAFPFLLLPLLGQATGALLTGAVNAVAGSVVVLWLFPAEPSRRVRAALWGVCGMVLVVLAVAAALTGAFERAARHALYGAPVRFAAQSRYQEIVLTGPAAAGPPPTHLGDDAVTGTGTGTDPGTDPDTGTGTGTATGPVLGAGKGPGTGRGARVAPVAEVGGADPPGPRSNPRVPPPRTAADGYPLVAVPPSTFMPTTATPNTFTPGTVTPGTDPFRTPGPTPPRTTARPPGTVPPGFAAPGFAAPGFAAPGTVPPADADLRLYLGGRLAVCGADQSLYHAALVQPALAGPHGRVLVLGGGDGLAAAEVLRHPGVRQVTVVEIDPDVLRLARTDPVLTRLNHRALDDRRVRTVTADAFGWLRTAPRQEQPYDVIVADLPDPDLDAGRKLYTEEFYGLALRMLAPGGRLAVHAGSVTTGGYWDADQTLRASGLRTVEYSVPADPACAGPGDWGFVLASVLPPVLRPSDDGASLPGSLDAAALRLAATLADTRRPVRNQVPSTLLHPR